MKEKPESHRMTVRRTKKAREMAARDVEASRETNHLSFWVVCWARWLAIGVLG